MEIPLVVNLPRVAVSLINAVLDAPKPLQNALQAAANLLRDVVTLPFANALAINAARSRRLRIALENVHQESVSLQSAATLQKDVVRPRRPVLLIAVVPQKRPQLKKKACIQPSSLRLLE